MVGLSPKALRFADTTMRAYLDEGANSSDEREIWLRWRAERGPSVQAGPDGYVEVPDEIGQILRDAVERMIADLKHQSAEGDEDGDLGNDIAFLSAVHGKLDADLNADRRFGW
ncbi:hypothetical protein MTDSW087_00295 [Methylobacterium dankookense]|uniref:Uncharacterized protein n=2 Tax=Methylobacterium dankookense TaxID=560405 RepID=A0A564FRQ5_9HYPH|nr:hypothetical protein IFDJLNFL_1769 [Methylobacterium dankookense]VUF10627.1 hypothetical protein MTDSW087_00295 [Methylobacterium dankookense]